MSELMQLILVFLGGGVGVKIMDLIANRSHAKAYSMGAVDHAIETALASVTNQLQTTDRRLTDCEDGRDRLATEIQRLATVKADREEVERLAVVKADRQELIATMMRGDVAGLMETAPK